VAGNKEAVDWPFPMKPSEPIAEGVGKLGPIGVAHPASVALLDEFAIGVS